MSDLTPIMRTQTVHELMKNIDASNYFLKQRADRYIKKWFEKQGKTEIVTSKLVTRTASDPDNVEIIYDYYSTRTEGQWIHSSMIVPIADIQQAWDEG